MDIIDLYFVELEIFKNKKIEIIKHKISNFPLPVDLTADFQLQMELANKEEYKDISLFRHIEEKKYNRKYIKKILKYVFKKCQREIINSKGLNKSFYIWLNLQIFTSIKTEFKLFNYFINRNICKHMLIHDMESFDLDLVNKVLDLRSKCKVDLFEGNRLWFGFFGYNFCESIIQNEYIIKSNIFKNYMKKYYKSWFSEI
jgi:hypothetical protein